MSDLAGPTARIVGGPARFERVSLTWPVEYDGKLHEAIIVRRMTLAEVRTFVDAIGTDNPPTRFPMCEDDAASPIPAAVLDALDPDDEEELDAVVARFLPHRFQAAPLLSASVPETGDASAPT